MQIKFLHVFAIINLVPFAHSCFNTAVVNGPTKSFLKAPLLLTTAKALAVIATHSGLASAQVARQEVFGANPSNLSQTYFFGAVSDTPADEVPEFFQLSFQIGSVFGPALAPSEYYTIISGSTAESGFYDNIIAPNVSIKDFSGKFGAASYHGSRHWESTTATVDDDTQKIFGSMVLPNNTGPPAYACGPEEGTNLHKLITAKSSANEIKMLQETNWAHMSLGAGNVNMSVNDTLFSFSGAMEAETSWSPPYQVVYSRFFYGFGTLGPYTFAFWSVAPIDEPNNFATIGYFTKDGKILANSCNKGTDADGTRVFSTGAQNVTGAPFNLPKGFDILFHAKDTEYKLHVNTTQASFAPLPVGTTVSFVGSVKGGVSCPEDVPQYKGNAYVLGFAGLGCE
ncbi:hypothetical protein MMC13_004918 [Lambiella insularis]|nr:hypothetical protein [Lambiella insularis]